MLKKNKKISVKKIILFACLLALVVLMIISFSAPQHVTEVVLFQ